MQETTFPEVSTIFFVGPHFWLTKHYLNVDRKDGVLQGARSQAHQGGRGPAPRRTTSW
jgi:hypothetical protein